MANETVRDILDRVREFHRDLAGYYEALEGVTGKERLRMVLEYLARHEERVDECIGRYESEAGEGVLGTWYKGAPATEWKALSRDLTLTSEMTVTDVLRQVLRFQESLAALYSDLAERAPSAETRDLFSELLLLERTEEHNVVRDTIEMEDL